MCCCVTRQSSATNPFTQLSSTGVRLSTNLPGRVGQHSGVVLMSAAHFYLDTSIGESHWQTETDFL